jgi:O-antigen/teichoic acid export membrane protein
MAESRVKKTLLNARVNLIFYFLALLLSFFSRKIFLDTLGADFVGLTGTLYNLLGFLNLAELGIGSAIGYVLYKPLYDQDKTKINEIIAVFGYLYRRIGLIILGAGCLSACFLPLIFPSTGFEFGIIYFAYFSFLASSLIGYFANYKQTLLGADQRNYVVTAYFQTATIVKTLIQLAFACYTGNYYLWIAIELVFGVVYSIILNWKINRVYPWLKNEVRQGKELFRKYPEVMKYTKQLFVHKIGDIIQKETVPFFIYAFVSLKTVAYYGNYTLITTKLNAFLDNLLGSTKAGIGNLIAEGNKEKIYKTYWELMSFRFWVAGIFVFSMYKLIPPFIRLWLGKEYLLPNSLLILLMINLFMGLLKENTEQFSFGYGLFHDIWAPLAEAGICFMIAIIGGYFIGLNGIVLGSTVSLLIIVGIWKPYLLFSKGFKISVIKYWLNFLLYIVLTFISFAVTNYCLDTLCTRFPISNNWGNLLICGIFTFFFMALIYFIFMYLFTSGMRTFFNRIFTFFKQR